MGLGKGLSALISNDAMDELNNAFIADLPIEKIVPNTYQPRIAINPEALLELADSIREHGVIEPLIVTKRNDNTYELIAGERRWRAAKLAQVGKVPVVVKEASPQQMLEMAIVENVQREDLNPLEEAAAFEQLVKMFGLTHKEIGKKVGFSRAAIANKIRLLVLPEEVKKMLLEEQLSEGHARAMLGLQDLGSMITVAKIVVRDNLSVRAVEELVRRLNQGVNKHKKSTDRIIDEYTQKIETTLKERFGNKLKLFRSAKGGKIVIPFEDDNQLENIYKSLTL
jgi:ParB family transcriptional regulator, chromosome partitioning protein